VTPLVQAFSPHFTELVSRGEAAGLSRQLRLASQLTGALVLPPAALLIVLSPAILSAWIGNTTVAAQAAPLLSVLTIGTLLVACSLPSLSVLFSQKRLRPIIGLNVAAVVVLVPLLTIVVKAFGTPGAASCWVLYGATLFVAYQALAHQGLTDATVPSMLRDFGAPGVVSMAVAGFTWYLSPRWYGRFETITLLALALLVGWAAALVACRDLFRIVTARFRWHPIATRWSA
jgi:O-antigen/teichoic acid export membrane protein